MKIKHILSVLFLGLAMIGGDCFAQSKTELFNRDAAKLVKEIRQMLATDQQFRGIGEIADSNISKVKVIDEANTIRMIEIIRKYGFPSTERTARLDNDMAAFILLMHAPDKYFDELKILLKSELDAHRITSFEYAQVTWHLNGRVGVPSF